MEKQLTYFFCVLLTELCGMAAGLLTRSGARLYATTIVKPPLAPPGLVFPIAWTVLYALMGVGLARVLLTEASTWRMMGTVLYVVQLIFNLSWCFIFFSAQHYGVAVLWLVALFLLVVFMVICFRSVDAIAAYLQLPYLVWLLFAGYLCVGVYLLNPAE